MARAKRFTGREALGIDPTTISDAGLRGAVRALADIANKRLKRFEAADLSFAPAYKSTMESLSGKGRTKFKTKGLDRRELEQEWFRAKKMLTAETGTVTEAKAYYEVLRVEAEKYGLVFDRITFSGVTELYYRLIELDPTIANLPPSEIKNEITRIQRDGYDDFSVLVKMLKRNGELINVNKEQEKKNAASDFFTPNNV